MRKLLLTSSGLSPELLETLAKLLVTKPEETKVAYIGTANNEEPDKSYQLKSKATLASIGIHDIMEIDLAQKPDLAVLDACHIVFVDGGNTYYLLKAIRESKFDQKLKELLSNDKMYVGVSAGSMVLGTSIETAALGNADRNDVGLEDPRALRQVPFMIAPHFVDAHQAEMDAFAKKAALRPIIGLEDGQAILCMGDRYKLIGPGKPHTWNSKLFR